MQGQRQTELKNKNGKSTFYTFVLLLQFIVFCESEEMFNVQQISECSAGFRLNGVSVFVLIKCAIKSIFYLKLSL